MEEDSYSRRIFLRKFALASTGTLIVGCGEALASKHKAVYGPPPFRYDASKVHWYYVGPAPEGAMAPLKDSKDVPIDAEFRIDLGDAVDLIKNALPEVSFSGSAGDQVEFRQSWVKERFVSIVPIKPLKPGVEYTLLLRLTGAYRKQKVMMGEPSSVNFRTRPA